MVLNLPEMASAFPSRRQSTGHLAGINSGQTEGLYSNKEENH